MVAYKLVAHSFQGGHHHVVEQVVPLYVQIGGLRRYPQSPYVLFQSQVGVLGVGVFALELPCLPCHLAAQLLYVRISRMESEVAHFYGMVEIGDGELSVNSFPVEPYAPHEQREDGLAVKAQVLPEVEYRLVVQRYGDTHVVQALGTALQVLYGIGIGVEHVGIVVYGARHRRGALKEIVVVGVHAGNHALAGIARYQVHQHRALALRQRVARRQHHFEVTVCVLELAQCRAPEEYVVVSLHIRHDPLSRPASLQAVGCLKVVGRQIVPKLFSHQVFPLLILR